MTDALARTATAPIRSNKFCQESPFRKEDKILRQAQKIARYSGLLREQIETLSPVICRATLYFDWHIRESRKLVTFFDIVDISKKSGHLNGTGVHLAIC